MEGWEAAAVTLEAEYTVMCSMSRDCKLPARVVCPLKLVTDKRRSRASQQPIPREQPTTRRDSRLP